MNYTLTPMNALGIGAEIRGLDTTMPVSDEVRRQLNADFAKYHVLALRDQKLSADQFLASCGLFGEIMEHHRKNSATPENPRVYEIRNIETSPGKYFISGASFHTDHSNDPVPPKATALHAISLPSYGGDTQFVDMHQAYDDLPETMKQRLGKLKAVHVYQSKYSPRKLRVVDAQTIQHTPPPAIHPLVRTHPENGRKFLYINPVRIESILGMPDEESQALIAELMAHATQLKYEYRHKWLHGDMVIWDDRSVLHKANGDYDMKELRRMYRLMIRGVVHADETPTTADASLQRLPTGVV